MQIVMLEGPVGLYYGTLSMAHMACQRAKGWPVNSMINDLTDNQRVASSVADGFHLSMRSSYSLCRLGIKMIRRKVLHR